MNSQKDLSMSLSDRSWVGEWNDENTGRTMRNSVLARHACSMACRRPAPITPTRPTTIGSGRSPSRAWSRISSLSTPHAFLHVRARNEDGESVVWACEMQTANTLRRQGWSEDRFTAGQAVTVAAIAARRGSVGLLLPSPRNWPTAPSSNVPAPSFRRPEGRRPRGSARGPSSRRNTESGRTLDAGPGAGGNAVRVPERRGPWRGAAYAGRFGCGGRATMSDVDDPSFECSASSITRAWSEPGTPTEIEQYDDRVVIRHEYMDTVRTIRLAREPCVLAAAAALRAFHRLVRRLDAGGGYRGILRRRVDAPSGYPAQRSAARHPSGSA